MARDIGIGELHSLVKTIYAKLNDVIEGRVDEYQRSGKIVPQRIGFDQINLSELLEDLIVVQRAVHWGCSYSSLDRETQRQARVVAFACVCQFIKDEYDGSFWAAYKKRIGLGADNRIYNTVWMPTFKELGVELIRSAERREFVQSFVLEVGIPKGRHKDAIDLFKYYWRYFRSQADTESLMAGLVNGTLDLDHLPASDRVEISRISNCAREYPVPFARVLSSLSRVFAYIERNPSKLVGSLQENAATITAGCGVDPLIVLHSAERLEELLGQVIGLVTPKGLKSLLDRLPQKTRIVIPSGSVVEIEEYDFIQYGKHVVKDIPYTCVPSLAYHPSDLAALPKNEVLQYGDIVLLRVSSAIDVEVNERERPDLVRVLWSEGKHAGSLFYIELKPAMVLRLATICGSVDAVLVGQDGVSGEISLKSIWNPKSRSYFLALSIPHYRLMLPDHASEAVSLHCSAWIDSSMEIFLDENGIGHAEGDREIEDPEPGPIEASLIEESTQDAISINGQVVKHLVELDEVMLFSAALGYNIRQTQKEGLSSYGGSRLALYIDAGIPKDRIQFVNLSSGIKKSGKYRVYSLLWSDKTAPCAISIKAHDDRIIYNWQFAECIEYELITRKNERAKENSIELDSRQVTDGALMEIQLSPFPSIEMQAHLQWTLLVNHEAQAIVPFGRLEFTLDDREDDWPCTKNLSKVLEEEGLVPEGEPYSVKVCLTSSTEQSILAEVSYQVYPDIHIQDDREFEEYDEVAISVSVSMSCRPVKIVLVHDIGGTAAKLSVGATESGEVVLQERLKYRGYVRIPSSERAIPLVYSPWVNGLRFMNKKESMIELPRDLSKIEVCDYDLILVNRDIAQVVLQVNGVPVDLTAEFEDFIWRLPIQDIPGFVLPENVVTITTSTSNYVVNVKHRARVLSADFDCKVREGYIAGTMAYCGPLGSKIDVTIRDHATKEISSSTTKICDGHIHDGEVIRMHVGDDLGVSILSIAVVDDMEAVGVGHTYGQSWVINEAESDDDDDISILLNAARTAFGNERYFLADKLLNQAVKSKPAIEHDIKSFKGEIEVKKTCVRIDSLSSQIATILKKEELIDV